MLKLSPKKLFLIDGLGALLSAFLLGVILVKYEPIFGVPVKVLYFLSIIAFIFAIYSLTNFWQFKENGRPYLKVIAVANLLYCCLTVALTVYFRNDLTGLGLLYFLLEVMIVTTLALIELKNGHFY